MYRQRHTLHSTRRRRLPAAAAVFAASAAAAAILMGSGCAYFNTFYNAKAEFKRGEDERKAGATGEASYGKSIEKCQSLLRYYPKSKYVDDALFLMGMARFHRQEYVQARAAFEDLFERFPNSEYIEQARYWSGYAALRQGDTGAAGQAFAKLAKDYPNSKLNIEAVFRQAEAQLDARDYERARDELRAFMKAHPKSRLAAEAQLRLARTYHEEHRYAEARVEYDRVLEQDISDEVRYEARLNSSLAMRAIAADVLSDPALRATTASGDSSGAAPPVSAEPVVLTAVQDSMLAVAQAQVDHVWNSLLITRKLAGKLGKQVEHDIELAVTRAMRGDQEAAIEDLDQIARSQPRTGLAAQARYEIGEIHRRNGNLTAARTAYDEASRETGTSPPAVAARNKSSAIAARQAANERLAAAPEVLQRWQAAGGTLPDAVDEALDNALLDAATSEPAAADTAVASTGGTRDTPAPRAAADSLAGRLALASEFEALAAEQLRVAEIDLLELDQPLVALREFEHVVTRYSSSSQAPRAAFAIAWIYDYRLRDRARARDAYENVVEDFPSSPQGRAAQEILAQWDSPEREVQRPFSRP